MAEITLHDVRATIRTTVADAVLVLWRAWLVSTVTELADSDPPQMFCVVDGRWCVYLRPYHPAPHCLGIDATPEQTEVHEAFRKVHASADRARTPIRLAL